MVDERTSKITTTKIRKSMSCCSRWLMLYYTITTIQKESIAKC